MGRKKILLVDDSNTVLMMQQSILDGCPYDLLVAKNGEEGVAQAQRERPDLILMDVNMPRLDGVGARARLLGDEATRGIPVVFVTTKLELPGLEKKLGGAFDHVLKPFDADSLRAKVKQYLGE